MKKLNSLGQQLTSDELKNVMAGSIPYCYFRLTCKNGRSMIGGRYQIGQILSYECQMGASIFCGGHDNVSSCYSVDCQLN